MSGPETRIEGAQRRAAERIKISPDGLRATAKELRDRAQTMTDPNDGAAMLNLASDHERRAQELDTRLKDRILK
jgi:hypothetical protein